MKVKELIKQLSSLPQDLEVVLPRGRDLNSSANGVTVGKFVQNLQEFTKIPTNSSEIDEANSVLISF